MKLKTKLYLILFAILLFNLFQLFINLESEFDDFETYSEAGNALLSGQNPYVLEIAEKQYPPGHFYIYAAIIFLFGQNKLAFKLVVLAVHYTLGYCIFLLVRKIVEINQDFKKKHPHINQQTVTRLHKKNRITIPPLVARDLKNKELIPWTAMFLFLIFPPELMRAFSGLNDPFPT